MAYAFFYVASLSACLEGTGKVQVFIEVEDSIPNGILAGAGAEEIVDGWDVEYQDFLVTVGGFRAQRSAAPGDTLENSDVIALNLLNLPSGGLVIAEFNDVTAARFDRVGFDLPNADANTLAGEGIDDESAERLRGAGLSLFVTGSISNPNGMSCAPTEPSNCVAATSIAFSWELKVGTSYDGCAPPQGDSGFAVPSGGTVQVKPTIHGDHWFFNNVTQGEERTERRAQWLADCDLDHDGIVTLEELEAVDAGDVFLASLGYNLTGALIPIETARDFLEAQARTLGDFQGDGECPDRSVLD